MKHGSTDAGDSLTTIKKLVFEDKKITMAELCDALDSDFEGSGSTAFGKTSGGAPCDGSSPSAGKDLKEPTAVLKSMGCRGYVANQRIRA